MSTQEWFNLFVRGAHVLAAILWIGDSFLFMWLDSKLAKPTQDRAGDVVGELWMAHSGGFYELVKRRSLTTLPDELFFFKWESYATWITGMLLIASAYWFGSRSMLVDGSAAVSQPVAVGISAGLLVLGTAGYHALCHTPLIRSAAAFGAVGLVAVTAVAVALTGVFAPRAVPLQIGAMLGTIMTSNVFFVIVDAQRHMVAATAAGAPVDTSYGARAKQRSTHNHYLTFPVLLAMLSNHFPGLYAGPAAPIALPLVFLVAVGVKYAMSHRAQTPGWVAAGTVAALGAVIVATRPTGAAAAVSLADVPTVPFATAEAIVQTRCVSCHAEHPTNPGFSAPPQGVALETPRAMRDHAERILQWSVTTRAMPLGNATGMTDDERRLLGGWILQGAAIPVPGSVEAEAQAVFSGRCAACHGAGGAGDGIVAPSLDPPPRNYRDAAWQAGVTDADLGRVIREGGAAVGKSPAMPANPDLSAEVVAELVRTIRSFRP